jgi:hypothetical protein
VKELRFSTRTILGIIIDLSEQQFLNGAPAIWQRCEPASNVNSVRDEQSEKHSDPLISTEAGIHRDRRDEHPENDLGPIFFRHDIPAKVNSERKTQSRKHSSPSDSTDARTVKDVMGLPENALGWIVVAAGIAEFEEGVVIR